MGESEPEPIANDHATLEEVFTSRTFGHPLPGTGAGNVVPEMVAGPKAFFVRNRFIASAAVAAAALSIVGLSIGSGHLVPPVISAHSAGSGVPGFGTTTTTTAPGPVGAAPVVPTGPASTGTAGAGNQSLGVGQPSGTGTSVSPVNTVAATRSSRPSGGSTLIVVGTGSSAPTVGGTGSPTDCGWDGSDDTDHADHHDDHSGFVSDRWSATRGRRRDREWLGQRGREWLGQRDREWLGQRDREWLGQRDREWLGQRDREWLGQTGSGVARATGSGVAPPPPPALGLARDPGTGTGSGTATGTGTGTGNGKRPPTPRRVGNPTAGPGTAHRRSALGPAAAADPAASASSVPAPPPPAPVSATSDWPCRPRCQRRSHWTSPAPGGSATGAWNWSGRSPAAATGTPAGAGPVAARSLARRASLNECAWPNGGATDQLTTRDLAF